MTIKLHEYQKYPFDEAPSEGEVITLNFPLGAGKSIALFGGLLSHILKNNSNAKILILSPRSELINQAREFAINKFNLKGDINFKILTRKTKIEDYDYVIFYNCGYRSKTVENLIQKHKHTKFIKA